MLYPLRGVKFAQVLSMSIVNPPPQDPKYQKYPFTFGLYLHAPTVRTPTNHPLFLFVCVAWVPSPIKVSPPPPTISDRPATLLLLLQIKI